MSSAWWVDFFMGLQLCNLNLYLDKSVNHLETTISIPFWSSFGLIHPIIFRRIVFICLFNKSLNKTIFVKLFQNLKFPFQRCALKSLKRFLHPKFILERLIQIQITHLSYHGHKKSVKWKQYEILWLKDCVYLSKSDSSTKKISSKVTNKEV